MSTQERQDIAFRLLQQYGGQINSYDLADACGYSFPQAFLKAFKKWTGESLLDYRERVYGYRYLRPKTGSHPQYQNVCT